MATIRPENSTTDGVQLGSDDVAVIGADVTIAPQFDAALITEGFDIVVRNYGVLSSGEGYSSSADGVGLDLINFGWMEGATGFDLLASDSAFQNRGTLIGASVALDLSGTFGSTIINTGLMSGGAQGILIDRGSSNVSLRNVGDIEGHAFGSSGIVVESGVMDVVINNAGRITGESSALSLYGDITTLRNLGQIEGSIRVGGDGFVLENRGEIIGGWNYGAIDATDLLAARVIANHGAIVGDINLQGYGDDIIRNHDDIIGNVETDGGDDRFLNTGYVQGIIDLGDGSDVFSGRPGAMARVRAGDGDDKVFGSRYNDVLGGDAGQDTISAGHGDDILVGGFGADVLTGGRGDDQFYFETIADSTLPERDLIRDFKQGEDLIVMWDIFDEVGDVDVDFIGNDAFSAEGEIELRYGANGSQRTEVALDVDGDGQADLIFDVGGLVSFTEDDFVLEFPFG